MTVSNAWAFAALVLLVPGIAASNVQPGPVIFISELADPNNNNDARFVELHSPSGANLTGYKLVRYSNANTAPSSVFGFVDLSGNTLAPHGFLLICASRTAFDAT